MLRHCEAENRCYDGIHRNCKRCNKRIALDMAIEALEGMCFDEWCDDCKEYDTEKKCCPRFNKVIREALKREPSEDGTLEVKVEDATKVGRVLISDDKHRGGLYYPDEDEPQSVSFENDTKIKSYSKDSDLISRADAIRVVEKNSYRMAGLTEVKLKCEIEAVPSADRPRGEWISVSEKPKDEKRTYLVQLDSGGMCSCRWTNVNPFWTDLTTEWHWNIFDIPQYSKVVAWMDLEPYKGGEGE